ncbi:MAG: Carbon-nitrogen hydrolase family protein [Candidatus Poribacteria bacterium]|nr:Carbon-nitrogen hydrolase family protein [Candidatus Poribacteria bacterium]
MEIRVSGAQIPVIEDIDSNVKTIERAIDYAISEKADILLTPEGSLSGYTHEFDVKATIEALDYVTKKARGSKLGLALGTCFLEQDEKCYNQIRFYKPDGEYLGFHSKTLTCGSLTEPPKGEINNYAIKPLRTFDYNDICIGGLICNDLWANPGCTPIPDPHLTHQLSKMGAKIIFHAVNGGRNGSEWSDVAWHYHESNLRMRANASRIWIVTVDNCHPLDLKCSAPSGVIEPSGKWVCKAEPQGEQFFSYTIEIQ